VEFRSTNVFGRVHFHGDVVTNVGNAAAVSSHGVQLSGGSTGGIVTAAGDEADVALNLVGKGTGAVIVSNSSSPLVWGGGGITLSTGGTFQIGSTAPFAGWIRISDTAVATPNFNTTNAMVMETTHAITGVNSSHFVDAQGVNLSTDCCLANAYPGSTAGQVHCRFLKVSTVTVAATTATIQFVITRF
jgi:hypothetical protein